MPPTWDDPTIDALVELALTEDVGTGDVTTRATVPLDRNAQARVIARASGVIAGTPMVRRVLDRIDPGVETVIHVADGGAVRPDDVVLELRGRTSSILTAERTILNFLGRLSGVATLTRAHVDAVAGTRARIHDTRKTTPGHRILEKLAVLAGGGANHRMGLHDAILIKENHVAASGGVGAAVRAARDHLDREGLDLVLQVEVRTVDEAAEAIEAGATWLLLDNMTPAAVREARTLVDARIDGAVIEVSGGLRLDTVRAYAEAGADRLSVGALTHSAPALDLSLLVEAP